MADMTNIITVQVFAKGQMHLNNNQTTRIVSSENTRAIAQAAARHSQAYQILAELLRSSQKNLRTFSYTENSDEPIETHIFYISRVQIDSMNQTLAMLGANLRTSAGGMDVKPAA